MSSPSEGTQFTPIMREPSRFLKDVVALVKRAGERILEVYRSDFRVARKDDLSPLTAADLIANHCLTEGLQALPSVYPVLSEESVIIPFEDRRHWETFWLVDPLDGTREFVKRNGEFTVNVALIHQSRPVLGVVYAPAFDLCYFAAENCGAFRQRGAEAPAEIQVRLPASERPVVVGSRSHPSAKLADYLSRLDQYEVKSIGSSLKFCLVAEGSADLYPRLGPTSEWDTAAGHCIVEVAGGAVTDLGGEPLRYNARPTLLNPYFLAFGDKSRAWLTCASELDLEAGDAQAQAQIQA